MKKLTRLSLYELAKVMPVLTELEQRMCVGGYDERDCWWHCIAYFKSCGTNFGDSAAMSIAKEYYGSSFNADNYAFSGNKVTADNYISQYITGKGTYCTGTILTFDPNDPKLKSAGWSGIAGAKHSVILKDINNGYYRIFDPQNNTNDSIRCDILNSQSGAYRIIVK